MLLFSVSVGVFAGLFVSKVRLGLGMPGHKFFFWMTPVLIARLLNGCRIGTAAGGLSAALITYSLGGNLAGGLTGLPLIGISGLIMDWMVDISCKNKTSGAKMMLTVGLAAMMANMLCLAKRMMLPTGLNPHFIFGVSGFWFKVSSYMFFGFASGIVAAITQKGLKSASKRWLKYREKTLNRSIEN